MISTLLSKSHDDNTLKTLNQLTSRILHEFIDDTANGEALREIAKWYATERPVGDRVSEDENARLILIDLRSKQVISESQTEAFLCIRPSSQRMRNFQGLILLSALEHENMFKDPNRSQQAMMQFRLLYEDRAKAKRKSAEEIDRFLTAGWVSDEEFIKKVEAFFDDLAETGSAHEGYAKQRLLPVRRIVKDRLEKQVGNKRTYHARTKAPLLSDDKLEATHEAKTKPASTRNNEETGNDYPPPSSALSTHQVRARGVEEAEDFPAYIELTLEPAFEETTQEPSEQRVDNQLPAAYIATQVESSAPASLRRSFALSAAHAVSIAGSIERREKRLVCLTNRLTKFEIEILLAELRSRMTLSDAAYMLYLVLATGRKPAQLLEARHLRALDDMQQPGTAYILKNDTIFWLYMHSLPAHALPENQRKLLNQKKTPVMFPVPCSKQTLRPLPDMQCEELELQIEELIKEINNANGTRLSVGKIADHLTNFLHHEGIDDVLIALITGNPDIQKAGLYYTQFDTISIYNAYKRFRDKELGVKTQEPNVDNIAYGGSQLVIMENVATGIFDHLQKHLQALQHQRWDRIHNGFVMYTLHLLNVATGCRPVIDPFDDFGHIDLVNKKIFISDKESRQTASSARVLALPNTATKQVQLYKEHLERLYLQVQSLSPEFAQQVEEVLHDKRPFLFLIEREEAKGEIKMISISPKRIKYFWSGLLELPPNWHRHFLRTYLSREEKISAESIDTWMGHANPGQEGFTKFSGMSIKAMENIADSLERMMKRLQIAALSSKGHAHE